MSECGERSEAVSDFMWRDRALQSWTTSGTVLSTEKRTETHIHSTPGHLSQGPHFTSYTSGSVSSSNTVKHEFWIRLDDGVEQAIKLSGRDIPLREGQRITLMSVKSNTAKTGILAGVVNHSANRHWFLTNATAIDRMYRLGRWRSLADKSDAILAAFIGLPMWLILLFAIHSTDNGTVLFELIAGYGFGALVVGKMRAPERRRQVSTWLEEQAQIAHQQQQPVTLQHEPIPVVKRVG